MISPCNDPFILAPQSGCWPVESDPVNPREPATWPDLSPKGVRDNYIDVGPQPLPKPVLIPVPIGGNLHWLPVDPHSKIYQWAQEVQRINSDPATPRWVFHAIMAILSAGAVVSLILVLGGSVSAGTTTSVSWAPLLAAGLAIVTVCKAANIAVDSDILMFKDGSSSSLHKPMLYLDASQVESQRQYVIEVYPHEGGSAQTLVTITSPEGQCHEADSKAFWPCT